MAFMAVFDALLTSISSLAWNQVVPCHATCSISVHRHATINFKVAMSRIVHVNFFVAVVHYNHLELTWQTVN